ncbi:MAG TPA: peptide ABC transporter substrate-binding protein [Candidatus Saccharimonadales bacterium]
MNSRAFKLRFRRRLRMRKLQVEELGQQAEQQLERNFFRRLERLANVRRFAGTWLLLMLLLAGCLAGQMSALRHYYQHATPVAGGTYTEGILGSFTDANPLYATSQVDISVSRLLFSSLLTYDAKNNLVGDLAKDWSVDDSGRLYTVHLKPNVKWHDGKPFTSADVAFTYAVIQNQDARSPLNPSWQGVAVTAIDPLTVTFKLPNTLSSFPYSLTNGIVPKHILGGRPMNALRSLPFNTAEPVGTGPFSLSTLEVSGDTVDNRQERVALDAFRDYYGGRPKLDRFVIDTFRSKDAMLKSFKAQKINAMVGLTQVPDEFKKDANIWKYSMPLAAEVMVFFKTSVAPMSDATLRQALVRATNVPAVIAGLNYPTLPVREPLLPKQLGYNPAYAQAGFDLDAAEKMLDQDGWLVGKGGIRYKNGTPLTFSLHAPDNSEYTSVATTLQKQWRQAGVDLKVVLESDTDFQNTLSNHSYDALLYGISVGQDPDVFVYWDSKYADVRVQNRLNFSEYRSGTADAALQAGRTRTDPALRVVKYQPFLQAWQTDAPAVGLYQPHFLYITRGKVFGLDERTMNNAIDRYSTVAQWMIREKDISQTRK